MHVWAVCLWGLAEEVEVTAGHDGGRVEAEIQKDSYNFSGLDSNYRLKFLIEFDGVSRF